MTIPAPPSSALPPLRIEHRDRPLAASVVRKQVAAAAQPGPPAPDREAGMAAAAALPGSRRGLVR